MEKNLLEMVKRRPSPLGEVKRALNLTDEGLEEVLEKLQREGKVKVETFFGKKYVVPVKEN